MTRFPCAERRLLLQGLTVGALGAALGGPAWSQAYPSRSITVVSSSAPGGQSDAVIRFLANLMKDRLGQSVLVENRPGGFALVAVNYALNRPADGYNLLFQGMGSAHPVLSKNPQAVDLRKAMVPIGNVYTVPLVYYTRASLPVTTMDELIAYGKKAGRLKYGTYARTFELATAVLNNRLGGSLPHMVVSYKGDPAMITALLSNEIDFVAGPPSPYIPHVKAGTIRPLMIASAARSSAYAQTPTAAELGIKDYNVSFNIGLWAPAGTPPDIASRLGAAVRSAVESAEFKNYMKTLAVEPGDPTPQGLLKAYGDEVAFWTDAVRITGYKPQ